MGITYKNDRISVEYLRTLLRYDPDTGYLYWLPREGLYKSNFNSMCAGKIAGTKKKGYVQVVIQIDGKNAFFSGHRIAWALHYGAWPEERLDHVDRNGMNNRIENLREANVSQNAYNKASIVGKIHFKGVYHIRKSDKYAAQIKHDNQQWKWLGLHDRPEDAARAYDDAAKVLHGEFAVTNESLGLL